jgi:hypothetical protein
VGHDLLAASSTGHCHLPPSGRVVKRRSSLTSTSGLTPPYSAIYKQQLVCVTAYVGTFFAYVPL